MTAYLNKVKDVYAGTILYSENIVAQLSAMSATRDTRLFDRVERVMNDNVGSGNSDINSALRLAGDRLFDSSNGGRRDALKVLIVFTTGPAAKDVTNEIRKLSDQGMHDYML